MSAHEAAQATVESLTDQDFADLPTELQAELVDWWTRFNAWREQRDVVIDPDPEPDPYDKPVRIQGHWHSEPICAWPDCVTYLTRPQMAAIQGRR